MRKGGPRHAIERSPIHHDPQQVALLARIIVVKHGAEAPRIAGERLRQWSDAGDEVTASLWMEVADVARQTLLHRDRVPRGEGARPLIGDADHLDLRDLAAALGSERRRFTPKRAK